VQTNPTSSSSSPRSTTKEIDDDDDDQLNRIDTMNLREIVKDRDNEKIFLTIDQSIPKQEEDENTNDKMDHGLIPVSCSSSDEELDTNNQIPQTTNKNIFNPNTKSTTEDSTTNLLNDNDNISKR